MLRTRFLQNLVANILSPFRRFRFLLYQQIEKDKEKLRRTFFLVVSHKALSESKENSITYEVLYVDGAYLHLESDKDHNRLVNALLKANVEVYDSSKFSFQEMVDRHRARFNQSQFREEDL